MWILNKTVGPLVSLGLSLVLNKKVCANRRSWNDSIKVSSTFVPRKESRRCSKGNSTVGFSIRTEICVQSFHLSK